MSHFETRFKEDDVVPQAVVAQPNNAELEKGALPAYYPLNNEPEELVIGGHPRCKWRRWFKHRRAGGRRGCLHSAADEGGPRKRRSKIVRAIKFLLVGWLLLSLVHFAVVGYKATTAFKSLRCMTVTPSKHADGLVITLPMGSRRSVLVHDSLSGGDTFITHDAKVAKGTIQFAVSFANDTEQDAVYDGCAMRFRRSTAIGLIPREENGERAKISKFTVRVPVSLGHPSISFIGGGDKSVSDKKLQKIIKWWRKKHPEGKGNMPIENDA